jgi:hypothetical protein
MALSLFPSSRRKFLASTGLAFGAVTAAVGRLMASAGLGKRTMTTPDIYAPLGVRTHINAKGT